ncbi:hypothetical protein IQ07DRAFT_601353 [Pyrenochaeta sp. DS3sAY3a]|nr:hypothetical protein IQ07DRAFT_601353 [Pyrenochaeta sp. DS3sAY3a]
MSSTMRGARGLLVAARTWNARCTLAWAAEAKKSGVRGLLAATVGHGRQCLLDALQRLTNDERRACDAGPAHVAAAGPAGMLPNHCAADLRRGGSLPQVKTWNASGGDYVCREPGERRMCRTSTCCDPTPTPKCRWPPGMRDMAARLCPVPFSAMLVPLPHAAAARRAHRCRFGPRVHLSPASRCCSGAIYANKRPSVSTLRRRTVCIASMPCLAPGPASASPERLLVTFLTSPARPPPCSVEGSRNPPTMHGTCDS